MTDSYLDINKKSEETWCKRCIMNSLVDTQISFGKDGICHHCLRYDEVKVKKTVPAQEREATLDLLINKIKKSGEGKEYDCLIGVSGGVDSTYVAWLTKKYGLRPLAVHLDNGWNSELAVSNIEKALNILDVDLHTYVLDWEEFRDLQLAFLHSSTPDGEVPSDHAILASLWQEASKYKIKYIINGANFASESISVPNWSYGHSDWKYIKSIHKAFGEKKLDSFPRYTIFDLFWFNLVKGIRTVSLLNYVNYDKAVAMKLLEEKLGWVYYGGKHYESIYTRFWQGYALPRKFSIDKRYGHLSDLINSGQITREEALEEIKKSPYPSKEMEEEDRLYVIKKLNLNEESFKDWMAKEARSFQDFPNQYRALVWIKIIVNWMREMKIYPR